MPKGNRTPRLSPITPLHIRIAKLLATGHSAKEIGLKLGLKQSSVENQRDGLYLRLGLRGVVHLTHWAIREGYVEVMPR